MRKEYIQSAKTELERLQKQGNTQQTGELPNNEAPREQELRHTPFRQRKRRHRFFELPICLIYLTVDVIYPECVNTL